MKIKNFFLRLDYLFSFKQYPVDKHWDNVLNELLDNCKIVSIGKHTIKFKNGAKVWISNRWFSYGQPVNGDYEIKALPKPATAIRLYNIVCDLQDEYNKELIEDIRCKFGFQKTTEEDVKG